MATFLKPENALKRAEELIAVGQKQDALQALHDIITSKRNRNWQKTLEKIMFKYVELCVDMRKGRYAKDGLIQYRIVCQQVNVTSLEEVIKHFIHLSTEKAEQARSQARALEEALDVDDLEADNRPEDLMLSYVSGEKGKDRSDSELYKRTTEFRRLCEIIRNHLVNLNKYKDQRDRPDISAPESSQLYLDTRIEQLKVATEVELWQEAFRSAEDIHCLMCMVKKSPKPSLMVVYYAKLTEIFRILSSHLYYAYAWLKLFTLQKNFNKKLSQKDLQLIASSVVLAALSVTPYDNIHGASHTELENEKERNLRMVNLIGFNLDLKSDSREVLSRSSLISELVSKGVMNCVTQEVKDIYNILEHEFLPLELALKVQPLLNRISKIEGKLASAPSVPEIQLAQYVPALEKLTTLRLLQQLSQVYRTLKIQSLSHMIPFFDFSFVEKIFVDAVKGNFLSLKINHISGVVLFGNQVLEADGLRDHLIVFAESLNKARSQVHLPAKKSSKVADVLPGLAETVDKEHKRLLARKSIIEKRKEEQERQLLELEREEETKRLRLQKLTEEAEQKRLAAEYEQRKNQRILKEIEERELEEAQAMLAEAEKRGGKKKGKKPLIKGEKVTKESLLALARSEQLRERQETEKRLQKLAKTMDYLERAKREEEAPLIEGDFQRRLVDEMVLHERLQKQEVELSMSRHDGDLKEKQRLSRMLDHKNIFAERVLSGRQAEYNQMWSEAREQMEQVKRANKEARESRRKLLYYFRQEEEHQRKAREEEEARKREEQERLKKEEAERKAKLDEIAEKQKQERETEERARLEREALVGKATEPTPFDLGGGRAAEPQTAAPAASAAAAVPTPGKYVPKLRRAEVTSQAPTPEPDKWGSGRGEDRGGDKWLSDRGGGGSRPTWSSSRVSR